MAKLVAAITKSVGPVGNITLILGVIIYIFAVAGMKIFGDAYKTENSQDVPRWNFNDFWHAFVMVFRILCGEWIEPLWDCMKATSPLAILFFLPAFVIGNFIVSIQWSAKLLFLGNLSHLDTCVKTPDVFHAVLNVSGTIKPTTHTFTHKNTPQTNEDLSQYSHKIIARAS